ncbi:40694_t:CDS:2, partial [Gigaspora margarita]
LENVNEENIKESNANDISDEEYKKTELEFKQTEIEKHLRQHIKNSLSKDFICDRLKIKKKLIETIEKYIKIYTKQFIDFISDDMKQEILYNFNKIMLGV